MNKGVIYKVKFNAKNEKECFIKLERTEIINGKEYNIFLYYENFEEKKDPKAKLVPVDTPFTFNIDLISIVGKKLNFEVDKDIKKLISIEYEA